MNENLTSNNKAFIIFLELNKRTTCGQVQMSYWIDLDYISVLYRHIPKRPFYLYSTNLFEIDRLTDCNSLVDKILKEWGIE